MRHIYQRLPMVTISSTLPHHPVRSPSTSLMTRELVMYLHLVSPAALLRLYRSVVILLSRRITLRPGTSMVTLLPARRPLPSMFLRNSNPQCAGLPAIPMDQRPGTGIRNSVLALYGVMRVMQPVTTGQAASGGAQLPKSCRVSYSIQTLVLLPVRRILKQLWSSMTTATLPASMLAATRSVRVNTL